MSILSTDKKLISFGTDYSAGSGISIIDHTISIVPSAVGKVYSAGPNIGIYDVSGQPTISSKDWTQDIDQSSSGAVTESISYLNTWINGQYTEDIANVTNNLTALSGDLSAYYKKTETSSKEQINDALDYVSAHAVGDVEVNNYVHNNSATINEVNSAYQSNSANYLTGVNIPESATWNETSNVVSSNSAQWNQGKTYEGISPIVVNNNESKISADTWTLTAGDGISFVENSANKVTRIDCTATGDAGVNSFVTNNSASILDVNSSYKENSGTFLTAIPSDLATTGDVANLEQTISNTYYPKTNPSSFATESWVNSQGYITAHQDISNKLDSSAFSSVSGDFLTTAFGIPESGVWNETSNVVSSNSASWSEGKTYEGISPVVVNNNENKISADTWVLSAGDGVSLTDDSANKVTLINCTAQGGGGGALPTYEYTDNGLISAIDSSGLYSTSAGTATYTNKVLDNGNLGSNIDYSSTGYDLHRMVLNPTRTQFGITSGIYNSLRYATGACISYGSYPSTTSNKQWYGGYFKGNEWVISNAARGSDFAMIGGFKYGNVHLSGARTNGDDFNLCQYSVSGNNSSGSWKYGNEEDTVLRSVSALTGYVPQSAFDELKQSYDVLSASYVTLSSLFATYSGQWLLPNEGV